MKPVVLLAFSLITITCNRHSNLILYNGPGQELRSDDFKMSVNNRQVFIYKARVSKYPINQVWPGYQRPLSQTEIASFAYFDFEGEVEIKIRSNERIKKLDIRPKEFNIKSKVEDSLITIKLSKPCQFTVEVNGYHQALHIFANPIEDFNIDKKDSKVHYFGPGVHDAGTIHLKSNETVFIDGGAIVYGVIEAENAENVKIIGRGILDASKIKRNGAPNMITLKRVKNAYVGGIVLRDPQEWAVVPTDCDSVVFDNIKLIGLWRYNSDGIDIVNCKNISVKNAFIRSFDDNIVIRGVRIADNAPYNIIDNIVVDSCVLWNDWGRALEIGASTVADTIENIWFSNCYIPHFTAVAMDIQNCDRGYIKNIHYNNIFIEDPISDSLTLGKTPIVTNAWGKIIVLGIYDSFYANDTVRGNISDIYFNGIKYKKDNIMAYSYKYDSTLIIDDDKHFVRDNIYFGSIKFNSTFPNYIYLSGYDTGHSITNIFIKDFYVNEERQVDTSSIGKNEFVSNAILN